jgi:hypothetical protein
MQKNVDMSKAYFLVNGENYNLKDDKRLLIPYIQDGKTGLVTRQGEIKIEACYYDYIISDCYTIEDLIRVGRNYAFGYVQGNGNVKAYNGTKWGIMDAECNLLIPVEYDRIIISDDKKLFTVKKRPSSHAVINMGNEYIVPFGKYQWIDGFWRGYARVMKTLSPTTRLWGLIDKEGKEVLLVKYKGVSNFYGKNIRYATIYDINGETFNFPINK